MSPCTDRQDAPVLATAAASQDDPIVRHITERIALLRRICRDGVVVDAAPHRPHPVTGRFPA